MKLSQNQFTTARLKTDTKRKIERAKIQYRFSAFEDAVDFFLMFGLRSYRNSKKSIQEN